MYTLFEIHGVTMDGNISISFARDVYVAHNPDDSDEDVRERAIETITNELGTNLVITSIEEDEV